MKVTIEFDGYEDADEMRTALDGGKWKGVVWDLDQYLRQITKHGIINQEEASSEVIELAENFRLELRDIMANYNLSLD